MSLLTLPSKPITAEGLVSLAKRYLPKPAAAWATSTRFIRLEPAPSSPLRPAVPNSSLEPNLDSSSAKSSF